jgi:glutathione S-transferase
VKLYFSPASPYVRKVLASAIELDLEHRIERVPCSVHVIRRDVNVVVHNPLGQVPTLIADDGTVLYDSRVVCEYLDTLAGGHRLFPLPMDRRYRALTEQAASDGLLDAAVLARQELTLRPADKVWEPWREAQIAKIVSALDRMQQWSATFGDRVDIGTLTTACAIGYLEFRYADFDWRSGRGTLADWFESFARRPSIARTVPGERPS